MRLRAIAATLAASLSLIPAALAQDAKPAAGERVPTLLRTTPNGVTVIVREMHASPVVDVRVVVKNTGGLYEDRFLGAGISHYYEHLVAGGTTWNRHEDETNRILFGIGNVTNAYTAHDRTTYFITTASRSFDTALDLISDWLQHCALSPREVEREKEVILKEFEKGEDEPDKVLNRLYMETAFKVHPVRVPVIGFKQAFLDISYADLVEFFKARYVPDNLIVIVVGDVTAEATYAKVAAAFKDMPRRTVTAPAFPAEPPQVAPRRAEEELPGAQSAYVRIGYHSIPYTHPDLYPLDLLATILSEGRSSRLVRKLIDETKLVTSVRAASSTPGFDAGVFFVTYECEPAKVAAAEDVVRAEIARLITEPPTDAEIARAKVQTVTAYVFGGQAVDDLGDRIGWDYLGTGDPDFGERYVANMQKVSREDMVRVARQYLRDEVRTTAIVRPPATGAAPGVAGTGSAGPSSTAAQRTVLDNGLRVLIRPERSSPQVAVHLWHLAGVLAETEADNGICRLTGEMLQRGTTTRSAEALAQALDGMGASLNMVSGSNVLGLQLACLSRDFGAGCELLADMARNPAFDAQEFDRVRDRLLKLIAHEDDIPETEAQNLWRRTFFRTHPYRLTPLGRTDTVTKLTPDTLRAFQRRFLHPKNAVVAVYGDVDPAAALAEVKKRFGDWKSGPEAATPTAPAEPARPKEDAMVTKVSKKQGVVIVIGYAGVPAGHPDWYTLEVIDAATSGTFYPGGWFHETLRGGAEGLVYVVHAQNTPGVNAGYWTVYARTMPDLTDRVLALMREQFDKIRGNVLTGEELLRAQKVCISSQPILRQTNAAQAMDASLNELFGLGHDWSDKYAAGIEKVTLADVKRVANQYFQGGLTAIAAPAAAPANGGK